MDSIPAREDVPYLRPLRGPSTWPYVALAALALAAWAGFYYWSHLEAPMPQREPVARSSAPAPGPAAEPAVRHPIAAPQDAPAEALPSLEASDSLARRSIVDLIGGAAFADFVVPDQLVRRIVATVDNLPRQTAPRRMIPLNHVPGAFDPANPARYAPYIRVLESVNMNALVYTYARAYPLFQRAYEELGYPGLYFNDRLIQAIDDMLAAPELAAQPELIRPKVLYEFADPDLETRSAGQKVMLRMGPDNAARAKAKLLELRRELLAASRPR